VSGGKIKDMISGEMWENRKRKGRIDICKLAKIKATKREMFCGLLLRNQEVIKKL
jgi:hypothetical protein